jgi:hypothetical protein
MANEHEDEWQLAVKLDRQERVRTRVMNMVLGAIPLITGMLGGLGAITCVPPSRNPAHATMRLGAMVGLAVGGALAAVVRKRMLPWANPRLYGSGGADSEGA